MTIDEMKRLDKRILEIQDPFGNGLPSLRKIIEEISQKKEVPVTDVMRQYLCWKWSKY